MIVMGNSSGDGQRWVSQRETATAAADRIGQQRWQLNWRRDGNTIAMAITMNAGAVMGDGDGSGAILMGFGRCSAIDGGMAARL
jgi:hypothetical protein